MILIFRQPLIPKRMENASLITLLDDGLAGDRSAMEEFLVEASSMLNRLIPQRASSLGIKVGVENVGDLAQEILRTLVKDDFRRLRSFKRRASLATWLRTVVTNELIDSTRSRVFRQSRCTISLQQPLSDTPDAATVEDMLPDPGAMAYETLEYRMQIALIREAKQACLDEENRLIIDLWSAHRTEKEISALLDMNPNTVATRIRRAKAAIEDYVNEKLGVYVSRGMKAEDQRPTSGTQKV